MKYAFAVPLLIAIPVAAFLAALHCYDAGYVYGSLVVAFVGGLVEFYVLSLYTLDFMEETEDSVDAA